jgi:DNA-binding transcriptional regulator YhcF (GntR family)
VTVANHPDAVEPPTKADVAYVELRDQILRGALPAGARLEQEFLAASLGVSTTPLREALRRLEAEHLVVRTAHRDVVIAPLSLLEARQLFSVRMELDAMAIKQTAKNMTEEELALAYGLLDAPGPEMAVDYLRRHGVAHQAPLAPPLISAQTSNNWQAAAAQSGGFDPALMPGLAFRFASNAPFTGVKDPTVDNLMNEAAGSLNTATRQKIYYQIYSYIAKEAYAPRFCTRDRQATTWLTATSPGSGSPPRTRSPSTGVV